MYIPQKDDDLQMIDILVRSGSYGINQILNLKIMISVLI